MAARQAVTLAEVAGGRDNNFNLIRMIAASGVLVSHAFPIALGLGAEQPFEAATGYTLGWICVAIFFAISGFLITRSFDRKPQVASWLSARIARLFPGLIVVSVLIALLYGPAFTTLTTADYFSRPETYTYVPRNSSLVWLQYGLPGVFADHPYPEAINGSLWTLVHEVTCYLGVFLAGIAGALRSRRLFAVVLALYAVAYAASGLPGIAELVPGRLADLRALSFPFVIGMAFYLWRDRIRLSWLFTALLAGFCVLARATPLFEPLFVATLAYATFVVAYVPGGALRHYNRLGDYSYGMYVYAFPVQQAAIALAGPMSPLANMALAFPVTLLLAVVSWYRVEKPALDRRHILAGWFARWGRRSAHQVAANTAPCD